MAWTTPRSWSAGELVTASIMNTHIRDNENELRGGGIAIASQAALDFLYASSASQLARLAKGGAGTMVRLNSSAAAYEFTNPAALLGTSTASSATPTPNYDTDAFYELTALAAGATFGAPTGTPQNMQRLLIRVRDNGTARTLAWNAAYVDGGVTRPTTTVINKWTTIMYIYNSTISKLQCVGVAQEA